MNRVDVHIIHSPGEDRDWADQCAISLANEPINIYHISGIDGDIREARYQGFSCGTAEYVSFVDPDDFVEPGIFQQCIDALDNNPHVCGVYTLSTIVQDGSENKLIHEYREFGAFEYPKFLEIHQLTVMRRKELMFWYDREYDVIPKTTSGMQWLYWSMVKKMPWLALNVVGYHWRQHSKNNHSISSAVRDDDIQRAHDHMDVIWRTYNMPNTTDQHRIDVHILHMKNENPVWWKKCQESLIDEPINIHNLEGTVGDIRDGRWRGFNQGTAEFVSFVDPDDYIVPGVFAKCLEALDANPTVCGVYTTSDKIEEVGGKDISRGLVHPYRPWKRSKNPLLIEIHQIAVMRRSLLIPTMQQCLDDIPHMTPAEPWIYWALSLRAPWLALNVLGYKWRQHHYGAHNIRNDAITHDMNRTHEFIRTSW